MRATFPKQLLYGLGYLILFTGVGYLFYLGFFKPAPTCSDTIKNQDEVEVDCGGSCIACEILALKPVAATATIVGSGNRAVVLVTLTNPNVAYGLQTLAYTVRLLDADGLPVGETTHQSFLYPSEIRRVLEIGTSGISAAVRTEAIVSFTKESWQPLAVFPRPKVSVRQLAVASKTDTEFSATGVVRNENAFSLSRLTLVAVAKNPDGSPTSASQTLIQDLTPFSERSFSITLPFTGTLPSENLIDVFTEAQR